MPAVAASASMKAREAGVRSFCLVTFTGQPAPRRSVAPSSQSSIRLKLDSTLSKDQPGTAQSS